jgi:glucose/arabinose dehydrogenase
MAFEPDGTLYMTVSGALGRTSGWDPRKTDTDFGKVIRIRDDGSIPPDNPFAASRAPGLRFSPSATARCWSGFPASRLRGLCFIPATSSRHGRAT